MFKTIYIRFIALALLSLQTTLSWAVETTDRISFQVVALTPGETETQYISLVIVGSRKYSAYNLDIKIPEGVELAFDEGEEDVYFDSDCIIPYSKGNPKHQIDATYTAEDRNLRISCVSMSNAEFKANSGVVCYIGLTVPAFTKPGALEIEMSGLNLTTADGTKYEPAAGTNTNVSIGTSAKADLSVSSANKWSTVILPFATELPAGLKAYTCNSKSDEEKVFYLTEATQIDAYTPYILYSESGYAGTLEGEVDASQYPESGKVEAGYLTGAIEKQTTNEGYILQNKGEGVKFYLANPELSYTIPAGKCWATPTDAEQDSYDFSFAPTAVNSVAETVESKNENKYDINGVMIDSPRKGQLYIQSRKKLLR